MAPCHHGNGATGSTCRGDTCAEGTRMLSPEEQGTGNARQTLGTMDGTPATGRRLPSTLKPNHRAHHPPRTSSLVTQHSEGCHLF